MEVLPIVRGSQEGVKESQVVEADLRKYTVVHMKYTHHIRIHSHVNVQFDYGGYTHNYTMKYKQYISAYLPKVKWFRDSCSLREGGFVETGAGTKYGGKHYMYTQCKRMHQRQPLSRCQPQRTTGFYIKCYISRRWASGGQATTLSVLLPSTHCLEVQANNYSYRETTATFCNYTQSTSNVGILPLCLCFSVIGTRLTSLLQTYVSMMQQRLMLRMAAKLVSEVF